MRKIKFLNSFRALLALSLFIAGIVILNSDSSSTGDNTFHGFLVIAVSAYIVASITSPRRAPDFTVTIQRPSAN